MKLNAKEGLAFVPDGHDQAVVLRFCDELEALGKGVPFSEEGMVAHGFEFLGDIVEQGMAGVLDDAGFPVKDVRCAYNSAAQMMNDALMSKANAQGRDFGGQLGDDLPAYAEVSFALWRSRSGREHDVVWRKALDALKIDLVIAVHDGFMPKLAEVLIEVVGKRVVVVDDKDGHGISPVIVFAMDVATSPARALLRHS